MKQLLFLCLLLISLKGVCQDKNDSTAIVQLLKGDYSTMGNWDIKTHLNNITKDYLLIENGEVWDAAKETEWYQSNAHKIISRQDYFNIRTVKIFNNVAYAVYELKSVIKENNISKTKVWNESVIFRKHGGKWKIALIHSTPINAANQNAPQDNSDKPAAYGDNPKAGHYAKVNGINMYYEIYGEGQPLLLIHGNGG